MTKLFYLTSFTFLLLSASLTSKAATLTVADNLIVSVVNDETVDHGFVGTKSTFTLAPGKHALIVRYKDVFEDLDFAQDRVVESKNFVVKFNLDNEQQLSLTTTKINSLSAADAFSHSPKLLLKDEKKNILATSLVNVDDYKLAKQVDIAVNTLAGKQSLNSNAKPEASTTTASKPLTPQTHSTLTKVNAITMLNYWWQNASSEERALFKQSIASQK